MCAIAWRPLFAAPRPLPPRSLNFWVAVWQFVLGFPLLLPMAPASGVAVSDIGSALWQGSKCFFGINSQASDNCGLAPLFVTV